MIEVRVAAMGELSEFAVDPPGLICHPPEGALRCLRD
jgi:hypothetical protein